MDLQESAVSMLASIGLTILLLCNFTFASKPTETTLSLARNEGDSDTMKIGMTSRLTLTAKFSDPTDNVKIELLPSVTDTVFAVKQIVSVDKGAEITAGSAWNVDSLHKGPEYTDTDSIAYNSRVVYDLGDITFVAGTSTEETDYQVVIVYDVVMISMGSYSDGAEFWTSAGMEYDYIWISQISYVLDGTLATVSEETIVTAEDVSSITIGEPLTVDVTIGIPYPKASLTVEALVLNDTNDISVTDIRIKAALSAFDFQMNLPELVKTDKECPLKSSLTLDVGTVVNGESQWESPNTANFGITAEMTFLTRAAPAIVGNDYSLGLGVHVIAADNSSDEIWVTSFVLNAATTNLPSFTTFGPLDPDSLIISPGNVGEIQFDLQIPEKTEYIYTVELTTAGISDAHPALSLLSARATYYGTNLPCEIFDMSSSYTASTTEGPKDTGTYTFTLNNYGFNAEGNDRNKLTLAVVLMMKPHPDVNEDDQHQLTVNINNVGSQTAVITVGGPAPLPESVDYLFELTNSCPTNVFESGSSMMFDVIVTTERNVVAGEMTVQAPFPPALDVSYLQFCSARIKDVGENVVCAQEGDVTATMSSWLDDGVEDHASFTFDTMCNVQVVDDVQEDKFTIEIILQARDVEEILNGGINVSVGFGVTFSHTQLYVGSYDIQLLPPTVFDSITLVTAVEIATGDLPSGCTGCTQEEAVSFPSTLVLQWSPNRNDFYDQPFQYQSPTTSGENTRFQLEKPLIAKYVRLTDKTCKAGCRPSFSFVTESGDDVVYAYGTAAKSNKVKAHLMFALDKDNTTCFDLPIKSDSTTPPALWVVLNILTVTEAYNLTITGKSISCNSRTGLQVILPMFGKGAPLIGVTGNMGICEFSAEEGDESLKSCSYSCACSGIGCSSMSIFMLYKDETPASSYQLCGIDVQGY